MVCNCVLGESMVGNEHSVFVMVCVAVRICLLSEVERSSRRMLYSYEIVILLLVAR